jgi:hypothetical protein
VRHEYIYIYIMAHVELPKLEDLGLSLDICVRIRMAYANDQPIRVCLEHA